jgi:MFS superfamily sulfate permease-like transporter
MKITQAAFNVLVANPFAWRADWAWGLPLIVLNVVVHVVGLGLVSRRAVALTMMARRRPVAVFVAVTGATTLFATCLHGIEGGIWAAAYWILGAFPDFRSSMLYSLNAITSYGHTNLSLEDHWQLLGSLEALNGWLLFGLTTAFLFAVIQKAWLLGSKGVEENKM